MIDDFDLPRYLSPDRFDILFECPLNELKTPLRLVLGQRLLRVVLTGQPFCPL